MSSFLCVCAVLAIELLAACQALDCHRNKPEGDPNIAPTKLLQKVYDLVRRHVP